MTSDLQKLLTEETEQHQERRSTGRKILIQEVDEGEDECLWKERETESV